MKRKNHNTYTLVFAFILLIVGCVLSTYIYRRALTSHPESGSNIMIAYVFAIAICVAAFAVVTFNYLKWRIYNLVVPHKTTNIDMETSKLSGFIALIFLAGVIGMISLLILDAVGHMSAYTLEAGSIAGENELPNDQARKTLGAVGESMGTFGDFFGGVLNPLLTFCTIIALAIATLMQRIQLRDAKSATLKAQRQIKRQAFESTFFNLLNLHVAIVESLKFDSSIFQPPQGNQIAALLSNHLRPPKIVRGREVFPEFLRSTLKAASATRSQIDIYRELQKTHNDIVGHYFRNLFQILKLIENYSREEFPDPTVTGGASVRVAAKTARMRRETLKYYSNILRAQLSSHELAVLFLNCTDGTVDSGAFKKLLVKTSFLEHLPITCKSNGHLLIPSVDTTDLNLFEQYFEKAQGEIDPGAFGANDGISKYLAFKKMADA